MTSSQPAPAWLVAAASFAEFIGFKPGRPVRLSITIMFWLGFSVWFLYCMYRGLRAAAHELLPVDTPACAVRAELAFIVAGALFAKFLHFRRTHLIDVLQNIAVARREAPVEAPLARVTLGEHLVARRAHRVEHLVVGGERGDAVDGVAAEQEAEVAVDLAVEVVRLGPVVGDGRARARRGRKGHDRQDGLRRVRGGGETEEQHIVPSFFL